MDVVVQPSVPWMSLNDRIKDSGLFFPVDPGPSVSASTDVPHALAATRKGHSEPMLTNVSGQNWRYGGNVLQVSPSYWQGMIGE